MITLPSGRFIYCMSLENMYFYPWRSGDRVSVTCCGYFTTHFKFHLPNCESFYLIDAPLAGKRVLIPLPNLSRKFMSALLHEGRIVMCIHDLAVIWKWQHTESYHEFNRQHFTSTQPRCSELYGYLSSPALRSWISGEVGLEISEIMWVGAFEFNCDLRHIMVAIIDRVR